MSDWRACFAALSAGRRELFELLLLEEALSGGREADGAGSSRLAADGAAGPAPLSFGQQRLWLQERLNPGTAAFNTFATVRLVGPLDAAVLRRCCDEIARRHEALRTTFAESPEGPVQVAGPPAPVPLPLVDLRDLGASPRGEEEVRRLVAAAAALPFDLARGPLFRLLLLRLADAEHALVATMHHIVSDAWSMGVLARELGALYPAFRRGLPSPLPELPWQYADFARWQREYLKGEVLEELLAWWRRRLAGAPELLDLAPDRPRPRVRRFRGATRLRRLPAPLAAGLAALGREQGATLFMTLLAVFAVLLRDRTGTDDLVVGTDVANRTRTEAEPLIGFFVNQLVLRVDLGGDPTLLDLLARAREAALGAFEHQDLPFDRLVEELRPARSLGHNPLFQVMFSLYNVPGAGAGLDGLATSPVEMEGGAAIFDLTLYFLETEEGLTATLRYDADLFEAATAERLLAELELLAGWALAAPESRVAELTARLATARRKREDAAREGLRQARAKTLKTARRREIGARPEEK